MSRFTIALLAALIAAPAAAYDTAALMEQRRQVDDVLQQIFYDTPPADLAWTWYEMTERCTKELMLTSREQNPDSIKVRFTERALSQLVGCALDKGFKDRPGAIAPK